MPDRPLRARTALACEIARLDRQRFNEAVAADNYPCAPTTMRGSARIFEVDDIVPMFIFGRLVEDLIPPRRAGTIACQVHWKLKEGGQEQSVHIIRGMSGGTEVLLDSAARPGVTHMVKGDPILYSTCFYVSNVRNFVLRELEEARSILGDDE